MKEVTKEQRKKFKKMPKNKQNTLTKKIYIYEGVRPQYLISIHNRG